MQNAKPSTTARSSHSPARGLVCLLTCALLPFDTAQAADVIVVDSAGAGAHTTIQAAVNASSDGDVILVHAGSYAEEVTVTARALTIVADGSVTVTGHLFVRDLTAGQVLLLSGLDVQPPPGWATGPSYFGALDARSCDGLLRLQDCNLTGAWAEGAAPFGHPVALYAGGPGALLLDCADAAFVDCRVEGGTGSVAVVSPGGAGGPGVWARDTVRLAVVRTIASGGDGGVADDPGSGGSGVLLGGSTELNIAYGALFGGDAGCFSGFMGSPGWTTIGGDGLARGVGTTTWDFAGVFAGGHAASTGPCATPSGTASDGSPHTGTGTMQSISGFPNTLHAPALVRDGQPWSVEFVAEAGETVRLFHASETTFDFAPVFEQPRLIGGANVRRYPGAFVVPGSQRVTVGFPPLGLPPTVDGYVHWFQGFVTAPGGGSAFSSARAIVYLNAGF